jgi:hypothetical protein
VELLDQEPSQARLGMIRQCRRDCSQILTSSTLIAARKAADEAELHQSVFNLRLTGGAATSQKPGMCVCVCVCVCVQAVRVAVLEALVASGGATLDTFLTAARDPAAAVSVYM